MKNNKGITLVALVITIIVLLILAGVSISMVVGENGVLTRATNAAERTSDAEVETDLKMAVSSAQGEFVDVYLANNNADFLECIQDEDVSEADKGKKVKLSAAGYDITLTEYKEDDEATSEPKTKLRKACTIRKTDTTAPTWSFDLKPKGKMGAEVVNFKRTK